VTHPHINTSYPTSNKSATDTYTDTHILTTYTHPPNIVPTWSYHKQTQSQHQSPNNLISVLSW